MRDKQFYVLALALQNATKEQLDTLVTTIQQLVRKYTKGGQISDQQALEQAIIKELNKFYTVFVENLVITAQAVGKIEANKAIQQIVPLLEKVGLFEMAIEFYNDVQSYTDNIQARLLFSKQNDLTLKMRIKTLQNGSEKTIRNIITNAMREGKGAKEIAKLLEEYVNPLPNGKKVQPLSEYRKRFNRAKNYTPKGVPFGSVQYNALRIARTEVANVSRNATIRFYEDRFWVKGYRRVLSNRHPKRDECDDYAKEIYKNKEDVPPFHPNCLCAILPVVMSPSEIKQYINNNEDVFEKAVKISKELIGV